MRLARQRAKALEKLSDSLSCLGRRVVLVRTGDFVFVTFGALAGLGTLLGFGWMSALWVGQGLAPAHLSGLGLTGAVGIVGGSWIAALALDHRTLLERPFETLRRPAFVSWGGLAGAFLAIALCAAISHFGVLLLLDGFARGAPIGHLLGRIGCLTYGCCFGRHTRGPLSITYTHPEAKAVRVAGLHGVPLHPAAFYEAVLDGVLFVAVNAVALAGAPQGTSAALCLAGYGIGRFGIEFLRDNDGRMLPVGLAVNQVVSLALAAVGAMTLLPLYLFAPPTPPIAWGAVLNAAPTVLAALVPCAALVGLGFSLHRGRVGSW
ncbi:MAG: prolipoprotein diacylglyceryl transferase [Deltaproteobacteria bacterium]|nr:prolipoprotein diacylglyceryl transferase [Deltaproteobacteria bacterium]